VGIVDPVGHQHSVWLVSCHGLCCSTVFFSASTRSWAQRPNPNQGIQGSYPTLKADWYQLLACQLIPGELNSTNGQAIVSAARPLKILSDIAQAGRARMGREGGQRKERRCETESEREKKTLVSSCYAVAVSKRQRLVVPAKTRSGRP
jgi:hypothetical protein